MRRYELTSGIFLLALAAVQLTRILREWPVQVAGVSIPLWPSIIAVLVAGSLGIWGLRSARRPPPIL